MDGIKLDPKYGYYPWWPENGDGWIHPEDVTLARQLIPSERVFRRDGQQGPFVLLHYGDVRLRVKPALWQETPPPAYQIGDWVEVLSRGQHNEPRTGIIREVLWSTEGRACRYQIDDAGLPIPNFYAAEDLRPVEPTQPQEMVRIEPSEDDAELL